jgi:hypothetical protein
MPALSEGTYQGDWLVEEFGAPNYCREEISVLAPVDLNSGAVIGLATTLTTYYVPYDNAGGANTGKSAAAAAVLLDSVPALPSMTCSLVDASDVATGTTVQDHCLAVGDIIEVLGATDAELNVYATIVSVPTSKTFTIASSSVSDATYAVVIRKLNQKAVGILRGPCVVASLDWGTSDSTGITAGTAELLALLIKIREEV